MNESYLDGITEGHSFLKENPDLTIDELKNCEANAKINMQRHSGAMRDCFRGERDFWKNQIKMKLFTCVLL